MSKIKGEELWNPGGGERTRPFGVEKKKESSPTKTKALEKKYAPAELKTTGKVDAKVERKYPNIRTDSKGFVHKVNHRNDCEK